MSTKQTVLVVGDYNRKDFVDIFYECKEAINFRFIDYYSIDEVKNDWIKGYGEPIFWKDYADAFSLLKKVKPDKVVFFFIEAFNHAALNVACRELGIQTYHIDHGVRDFNLENQFQKYFDRALDNPPRVSLFNKVINKLNFSKLFVKVKSRLFFTRTLLRSNPENKKFLKHFFEVRKSNSVFKTFSIIKSPLRTAETYISFSPKVFEAHQIEDHLSQSHKVKFIGLPLFDNWASIIPAAEFENAIIFINQPLAYQQLLGWNRDFEAKFIEEFMNVCHKNGAKLYIKMHPYDKGSHWEKLIEEKKVTLIDDAQLIGKISQVRVVTGFFSTLLMPIAALPHTVLFTFENQPDKDIFPSEFLVKSGVSEPIYKVEYLHEVITNLDHFAEIQSSKKSQFIKEWMYNFDGQAGLRLREILSK